MHLQRLSRRSKYGRRNFHFLLWNNGRRTYLPKIRLHEIRDRIENERAIAKSMRDTCNAMKPGLNGRPSILPKEIAETLKLAGYNVARGRATRSRSFNNAEAIAFRFSLLDEGLRKALGTPEAMAAVESRAISRQMSWARKKLCGMDYQRAFREVLMEDGLVGNG